MNDTQCERREALEATIEVVDKCSSEMDVVSLNVPRTKVFALHRHSRAIH